MKLRVNYTIKGSYTLDSSDLELELDEDATNKDILEAATEAINEEPLLDIDPVADGITTIEVVEV